MQQTGTKGIQDKVWLGGKGDPERIVQETKIWTILTNVIFINQNLS